MMEPWDAVFSWRGPTYAAGAMFLVAAFGYVSGRPVAVYSSDLGTAIGFVIVAFVHAAFDRIRKPK